MERPSWAPSFERRMLETTALSKSKANSRRVVVMGGGTAGPPISDVFCDLDDYFVTSVAPASDNGGDSGELRDQLGVLPPGDVRRYLIAHAKDESQNHLRELFGFRFPSGSKYEGQVVGNFLSSACEVKWGRNDGVRIFSRLLNIRGEVYYVSTQDTHLVAKLSDGRELRGEDAIDLRDPQDDAWITKVWLEPAALADIKVLGALHEAEAVILAPGDFYTSLMAILLAELIIDQLNRSAASVVLVLSLMTKKAETHGYTALDFVDKLFAYGLQRLDGLVVNTEPPPAELLHAYAAQHSTPVLYTPEIHQELRRRGIRIYEGNYLNQDGLKQGLIRHDATKVVATLREAVEVK